MPTEQFSYLSLKDIPKPKEKYETIQATFPNVQSVLEILEANKFFVLENSKDNIVHFKRPNVAISIAGGLTAVGSHTIVDGWTPVNPNNDENIFDDEGMPDRSQSLPFVFIVSPGGINDLSTEVVLKTKPGVESGRCFNLLAKLINRPDLVKPQLSIEQLVGLVDSEISISDLKGLFVEWILRRGFINLENGTKKEVWLPLVSLYDKSTDKKGQTLLGTQQSVLGIGNDGCPLIGEIVSIDRNDFKTIGKTKVFEEKLHQLLGKRFEVMEFWKLLIEISARVSTVFTKDQQREGELREALKEFVF